MKPKSIAGIYVGIESRWQCHAAIVVDWQVRKLHRYDSVLLVQSRFGFPVYVSPLVSLWTAENNRAGAAGDVLLPDLLNDVFRVRAVDFVAERFIPEDVVGAGNL